MSNLEDVGSPITFDFLVKKNKKKCVCVQVCFCVECDCDERNGSLCFLLQVTNPGQEVQTFGSAFLNIMWPYELSNGKWLLYPVSLNFVDTADTLCTSSWALNPLGLNSSIPAGNTSVNHTVGKVG